MRGLAFLFASALIGACAPDHLLVVVSVDNAQSEELCVGLKLDGRRTTQGDFRVRQNLSRFAVRLPNTPASRGTLEVRVRGLSDMGIATQRGGTELQILDDSTELAAAVTLAPDPNPQGWTGTALRTDLGFQTVFGFGPEDIYAGAYAGQLFHFDGNSWSAMSWLTTGTHLYGLWGSDPSHLFVAASGNEIYQRIDNKWKGGKLSPGGFPSYHGVWGSDANNVWVVGEGGAIRHFDGTSWSSVPAVVTQDLWGIYGFAADDIWAVGTFPSATEPASTPATILHFDGTSWSKVTNNIQGTGILRGIWGSDPKNIWVVGDAQQILKWDGTTWVKFPYPLPGQVQMRNLKHVWGTDESNVWVVGDNSNLLRWNGKRWNFELSTPRDNIGAVWGTDPCNAWAVGYNGLTLHTPW